MFFAETISCLGQVIYHDKLEMAESTTDSIQQLEYQTTQTEIRLFSGLCNKFQRIVLILSWVAAPLKNVVQGRADVVPVVIHQKKVKSGALE